MNCPLCKGVMKDGFTSILIEREYGAKFVISNVPALICQQCGEDFVNLEITKKIEKLIHKLESEGIITGFVDFSKAA